MKLSTAAAALFLLVAVAARADTPLVAVASNLTQVMTEIADGYQRIDGTMPRLSFGSSGNFAHQILQGAPYDIFISADEEYVNRLRREFGEALPVRQFARGALCIFVPSTSALTGITTSEQLFNRLRYGSFRRLSIANPEYAPYGVAAEQAMQAGGLWVVERDRLLIGENVAQAAQFTLSGSVDAGFVPCSYRILDAFREAGAFVQVPDTWYRPILQFAVLLHPGNESARRLFEFLFSEAARAAVVRYGYELPPES